MNHEVIIGRQRPDKSIPVAVDGKMYKTLTAMMKDQGITQTTVYDIEIDGYSKEEAIGIAIDRAIKRQERLKEKEEKIPGGTSESSASSLPDSLTQTTPLGDRTVNMPPAADEVAYWNRYNKDRVFKKSPEPIKPIWQVRVEDEGKDTTIKFPYCRTCKYPLFRYDKLIGDYIWEIDKICPGCGQKIEWCDNR